MSSIDYEERYSAAAAQMVAAGVCSAERIPSFTYLKADILEGQLCEQYSSPNFHAFFDWWHHYTAYEQLRSGFCAKDQIPVLMVAYDALIESGELSKGDLTFLY